MATNAIDSESEDDVPKSRRDYKYEYFRGLTYNFGENIAGSCGYVALAQLLIYLLNANATLKISMTLLTAY